MDFRARYLRLQRIQSYGKALFSTFPDVVYHCTRCITVYKNGIESHEEYGGITTIPDYENKLFNGMVAALEVLKQIHIEHGEVIDEEPVFTKRILQPIEP